MVTIHSKGSFKNTMTFLKKARDKDYSFLHKYGEEGVAALSAATPVRTGKTASSWYYKIVDRGDSISIEWFNSNVNDGVPIAIVIQYGHATPNGGYVEGVDYINPALKPIFDRIEHSVWEKVKNWWPQK